MYHYSFRCSKGPELVAPKRWKARSLKNVKIRNNFEDKWNEPKFLHNSWHRNKMWLFLFQSVYLSLLAKSHFENEFLANKFKYISFTQECLHLTPYEKPCIGLRPVYLFSSYHVDIDTETRPYSCSISSVFGFRLMFSILAHCQRRHQYSLQKQHLQLRQDHKCRGCSVLPVVAVYRIYFLQSYFQGWR